MARINIFGNYQKPGKGVSKNQVLTKSRFALYFELLLRKFWDICLLNLVFFMFMVPYFLVSYLIMNLLNGTAVWNNDFQLSIIICLSPFAFSGPFIGGASRIARDFAREEPVFLFSDFMSTVKKNVGQTLVLSVIGYIGIAALTYAIPSYYSMSGGLRYIIFPLCLLAALAFIFMQYYVFTMAVSFKLKIKEILKNGLIFSFVCLFRNLLITLVIIIVLAICSAMFILGISYSLFFGFLLILIAGFLVGFTFYSVNFIIYPALKKYIIDPYYENNKEETSEVVNNKDSEKIERELPEYIYHNGRMVHRSVLEAENIFNDDINNGENQ